MTTRHIEVPDPHPDTLVHPPTGTGSREPLEDPPIDSEASSIIFPNRDPKRSDHSGSHRDPAHA